MERSSSFRWLLGLCFLVAPARVEAVVDVTTCNQLVPRGETGILRADLTCDSEYGVQLDTGATLNLQNYTLTFNFNPAWPTSAAVYCASAVDLRHSRCQVIGMPGGTGAVVGTARFGIFGDKVEVESVSVSGFYDWAIYGDKRAVLRDVSVTDCDHIAILARKKILAERVTASNSASGIVGGKIKGSEITVSGNTANGVASSKAVRIAKLTASGNGVGVWAERVRLDDSLLSGNGIDIAAAGKPRLQLTTCATSRKIENDASTSEAWGVCTSD
jgi:hypothetical protein